ncbi:MAG: alpha/beta hydrolase [Clostridiales bacterium]|nr:alpha/beta hydrolase [Clostridiales bacterium]
MKKIRNKAALVCAMVLLASGISACSKKAEGGSVLGTSLASQEEESSFTEDVEEKKSAIITSPSGKALVNHMSEKERASVVSGPLQVLDEPWVKATTEPSYITSDEYNDGVYFEIWEPETLNKDIEEHREEYIESGQDPDEIMAANIQYDVHYIPGAIVDGRYYNDIVMPSFKYDKGPGYYFALDDKNEGYVEEYKDYDELLKILPDLLDMYDSEKYKYITVSLSTSDKELMKKDIIRMFEAMMSGNYKLLPQNTYAEAESQFWEKELNRRQSQDMDYSWELDKDAVAAIKDQVIEYHLHDDELDRDFVVHVTLPKNYDSTKTYPAIVLTDAVWRFNDTAKIMKEIDEGRAVPHIVISIGQDYSICNSDNVERSAVFCEGKEKFLDFITDNLMPYLSEIYHFDYENTTLFGHSLGGVFAHYALTNSDRYENQPFGAYIVGSPAFWSPYSTEMSDYSEQIRDYGFFDRNETIKKKIWITGGTDEDEDYKEYFGDNDSTTEVISHLNERITSHGCKTCEVKMYKSHHYQYIPEMLVEYVDGVGK